MESTINFEQFRSNNDDHQGELDGNKSKMSNTKTTSSSHDYKNNSHEGQSRKRKHPSASMEAAIDADAKADAGVAGSSTTNTSTTTTTTTTSRRSIRPMEETTAHKMVAGQAIMDMSSAVKELIDNALDAKAKTITIKLVSYATPPQTNSQSKSRTTSKNTINNNMPGIDLIEVSDDGTGVPKADRPYLAMKHATSKLTSFDQLYGGPESSSVLPETTTPFTTLGFRGEALFSLATLSEQLIITTKCQGESVGEQLMFDQTGTLMEDRTTNVGACKVGTTVSVHKLFHPLPVRRLDFIKRIKTQRAQLLKLLQGYAILCRDVQFHVSDIIMSSSPNTNDNNSEQPSSRRQILKKDVRLVTKSNSPTLEHTISSVLGHAFLQDMVRIPTIQRPCRLDDSSKGGEESSKHNFDSDSTLVWKLEGLVSRAPMPITTASSSKIKQPPQQQARELQFLSVNQRPVDLNNSLSKVITNVWKSLFTGTVYSKNNKRPAAILSLTLPSHLVDINVSPNKREVLLSPEQDICDAVQTTLMELWSSQINGIFPTNEVLHMSQGGVSRTTTKTATTTSMSSFTTTKNTGTNGDVTNSNQALTIKPNAKPIIDLTQFLAPNEKDPGSQKDDATTGTPQSEKSTTKNKDDDDDDDDDNVVNDGSSSSTKTMATKAMSSTTTTISETERIHQLQLSQNQKTTVKTVPVQDILGKQRTNDNHQLSLHQNTRLSPTGTHHSQTNTLSFQRRSPPPPRPQLSLSQAMAQQALLLSSTPETARLMLRGATSPMRHSSGMMMSSISPPSDEPPRRPRRRGTLALGYLPNDNNDNHDPLALLNSSRMMMDHVIAAAAASSTPNRQRTMERRNAYVEPRAPNPHNHTSIPGGGGFGGGTTLTVREKNLDGIGITPQKPPPSMSLNCTNSSRANDNTINQRTPQPQPQPSSTHEAGMKRSYETDEEEEQPSTHTHDSQTEKELCHKRKKKKKKRKTNHSSTPSADGLAFLQSFAFDGTSNSNNHPLEDDKPECDGSSSASDSEDDDDDEDDHSSSSSSPVVIAQTSNNDDQDGNNNNSNSIIETPHVNKHSTKNTCTNNSTTTTNKNKNEVSIKNNPRKVTPQSVLSDNDNDDDDEDESSILHTNTATSTPAETKREEEVPVVWNAFSGMNSILRQYETQRRMARTLQEDYVRRQQQTQQHEQTDQSKTVDSIMDDGSSTNKEKEEDTVGTVPDKKSIATKTLSTSATPVSLSKEEFGQMQIVGQFNLGFILGVSPKNRDLWILDQHACDEKYNFEQYVKHSVIHEQTLLKPLPLELSASEENCVLDHIDVFRRNGFRFKYDSTKPPRHRLSLIALPHSGSGGGGRKAVQFGTEDVGALCAILGADGAYSSSSYTSGGGTGTDGSGMFGNNAVRRYAGGTGHDLSLLSSSQSSNIGQHQSATQNEQDESNNNDSQTSLKTQTVGIQGSNLARLPKAIAMFASRACRNSIMIGHPLSQKQMTQVVTKMCLVDQPWECPHGRPTIRHVTQLQSSLYQEEMEEHDYRTKFHLSSLRHNAMDSDDDDDDDDHEDSDSEQKVSEKDKHDEDGEASKGKKKDTTLNDNSIDNKQQQQQCHDEEVQV